jgi:hypothetical protein
MDPADAARTDEIVLQRVRGIVESALERDESIPARFEMRDERVERGAVERARMDEQDLS